MLVRVPIGEDVHQIGDVEVHVSLETKELILELKRAKKIELLNEIVEFNSPISASGSLEDIEPYPGQTRYS